MHHQYQNPLITRYASAEMSGIWSAQRKFSTWRKLWIALAETQQELGLAITDQQLDEMRQHVEDIDFAAAGLNQSQIEAIAAARGEGPQFTLIQGPPGTGKTTTIVELIRQLVWPAAG